MDRRGRIVVPAAGADPAALTGGDWWQLLTAGLLHLGLVHLALNITALWAYGGRLERAIGGHRLLGVYTLGLLGAATAVVLFGPVGVAVAGASGAILALMGGHVVMQRRAGGPVPWFSVLASLAIGFIPALGLSWIAHLGGLITGAVVTAILIRIRAATLPAHGEPVSLQGPHAGEPAGQRNADIPASPAEVLQKLQQHLRERGAGAAPALKRAVDGVDGLTLETTPDGRTVIVYTGRHAGPPAEASAAGGAAPNGAITPGEDGSPVVGQLPSSAAVVQVIARVGPYSDHAVSDGSGVVVYSDEHFTYTVTNVHVEAGQESVEVRFPGTARDEPGETGKVFRPSYLWLAARLAEADQAFRDLPIDEQHAIAKNTDLAVVRTRNRNGSPRPFVAVGSAPTAGARVIVQGHPGGGTLETTWGTMSYFTPGDGANPAHFTSVYVDDPAVAKGSSGGPVLDETGRSSSRSSPTTR
ncbi:MAG: rhomboid family intramembrane serine protease [Nocardioidaceae bacterium]